MLKALLVACILHSSPVLAQPAPKTPYVPHMSFDVASIRQSGAGRWITLESIPKSSLYLGERVSPWGLIMRAYGIAIGDTLKGLPDWATSDRYTLTAKSDAAADEALGALSEADFRAEKNHMLQELLRERFKLKVHSEIRLTTTYELVATDRAKQLMTPVRGDVLKTISTCDRRYSHRGIEVLSKGCPFYVFLNDLQQELGTEIVDHSGLVIDHVGDNGVYAYHLLWNESLETARAEDAYPPLREALKQQLGLELRKIKGPVTFWVVDHIERPTPN